MYTKLTDLPETIQSALSKLGYGRKDISLEVKESISPSVGGGSGLRGFCCIVNIETGETKTEVGSWGGQSMFQASAVNSVDSDHNYYTIPPNFAVIKGTTGGDRPVYATITISSSNIIKALPAKPELNDRDRWILYTFKWLTSQGRKDEYRRRNDTPTQDDINSLVSRGFLKQNKAGSCQITTEGKNCFRPGETVWHPSRNSG